MNSNKSYKKTKNIYCELNNNKVKPNENYDIEKKDSNKIKQEKNNLSEKY